MIRISYAITVVVGLAVTAAGPHASAGDRFSGVTIEPPFAAVLEKSQLLMEAGGAKIVVNPDGSRLLIGVGQVAFDKKSPAQQRLNKERVARQNALRELAAQTSPIQIVHRETVEEKSRIETLDGGQQRGEAIEEYLSVTTSQFETVVKDLPVVGKWYSAEGDVLFIAIGKEFPAEKPAP
jgi:hypothetical protein